MDRIVPVRTGMRGGTVRAFQNTFQGMEQHFNAHFDLPKQFYNVRISDFQNWTSFEAFISVPNFLSDACTPPSYLPSEKTLLPICLTFSGKSGTQLSYLGQGTDAVVLIMSDDH